MPFIFNVKTLWLEQSFLQFQKFLQIFMTVIGMSVFGLIIAVAFLICRKRSGNNRRNPQLVEFGPRVVGYPHRNAVFIPMEWNGGNPNGNRGGNLNGNGQNGQNDANGQNGQNDGNGQNGQQ